MEAGIESLLSDWNCVCKTASKMEVLLHVYEEKSYLVSITVSLAVGGSQC